MVSHHREMMNCRALDNHSLARAGSLFEKVACNMNMLVAVV